MTGFERWGKRNKKKDKRKIQKRDQTIKNGKEVQNEVKEKKKKKETQIKRKHLTDKKRQENPYVLHTY